MVKWRAVCITKRTVDDLSVDNKDVVFWDWELPGFGSGVSPTSTVWGSHVR